MTKNGISMGKERVFGYFLLKIPLYIRNWRISYKKDQEQDNIKSRTGQNLVENIFYILFYLLPPLLYRHTLVYFYYL